MRHRLLPLLLIGLAAPSVAGAPSAALAGPVSYEVRSWGRLLLRWQVNPDGSGEIWRGVQSGKGPGPVRRFRLRLEGDALQTFARNVEDVREATRNGIPCDKEIYDLPYGSVTWDYPGGKQVYRFDAGCRSEKGDEALEILGAASSNVETLAKIDAKPYVIEDDSPR